MRVFKIFVGISGLMFLIVILLSCAAFAIVKHVKIKDLVERGIEKELGINISIKELKYSPLLSHISAEGVTIDNPPGFDEAELAYLNSIHIVWDLAELLFMKKPDIYLAGIDLERLNIVKNAQGEVNIKELIPIRDPSVAARDETPFIFDVLILSIDKVSYTEYVRSGKKTTIYNIGIKNHAFVLLKDESEVIKLIIHNAIQNTDIGKLINLTVSPVVSGVTNTIDAAWGTAKTGAKSFFDIVSMPVKLIFGK